ncbi:MAG TPA: type 2 isopentenyl-diphosphate Delta-isomerase [Bacteroides sp.]|nr:type 2 isopentenyl-diphosphate Delta-isomerase [Bacteroides sp.]
MEERKKDHIDLALNSQTLPESLDKRFNYEPMLSAHPSGDDEPFEFLGKTQKVPLWVSSMTGGTKMAGTINRNLARACNEFGMGMGLGSCRIIMEDETHFEDFNMRPIIGDEYPFYANLGIAQIEMFLAEKQTGRIEELLGKLRADGLVIHVNPIQEWCQPEGDNLLKPPIETISELLALVEYPVIVKEVGQGMGPESLKALLKLPLEAIEFAAYGGTNFALVELMRADDQVRKFYEPASQVGHDAVEMTETINRLIDTEKETRCRQLIISGGIKSFLDGYYLIKKSKLPAIYGQASSFLQYARGDYKILREFVSHQVSGLRLAEAYLTLKED